MKNQEGERSSAERGTGRSLPFRSLPLFLAGGFLLFTLSLAIIGFFLPEPVPELSLALSPPRSLWDWGTDPLGRSMSILVVKSYTTILRIVFPATFFAGALGIPLGMIAGLFGGIADLLLSRLMDLFLAFPGILIAIFLASVLGPVPENLVLALALFGWTGFARLTRGEVIRLKSQLFLEAARSQGISGFRLYGKQILPHLFPPLLVQLLFSLQGGILAEAGLSFLGLSDPQTPSLGKLLSEGVRYLRTAPYLTLIPAAFLFLTLFALYELGDRWVERGNRRLEPF